MKLFFFCLLGTESLPGAETLMEDDEEFESASQVTGPVSGRNYSGLVHYLKKIFAWPSNL